MFKRSFSLFALVFTSSVAFAGQDPNTVFTPITGLREFTGEMIARPSDGFNNRGKERVLNRALAQELVADVIERYVPETDEYILRVPEGWNENRMASYLMKSGTFKYVEPNWRVFASYVPNDPLYPQQWHLPKIQAPAAWDLFRGNSSVIVAICDTGILQNHEDLAPRLVSGYNAWTSTTQAAGGVVNDTHGHGTHCAGIAAGFGNNGVGISGVAMNAQLMPIKIVNGSSGSSTIDVMTAGARWAVDHGARVISTSFSGFDSSSSVETTGLYIKQHNGIYLFAAGNDARNLTTGDWPDVTVVGASDQNDLRASFSAYGAAIDVFAPGVDIVSTYKGSSSTYASLSGTSMACPATAGVAAMITMTNPSLTGQQVEGALYASCDNIGSSATFGNGRVNLFKSIRYVYNNYPFVPTTYTVTRGAQSSGTIASLATIDGDAVNLQSLNLSSTETGIQVVVDSSTTISAMVDLTVSITSSTPSQHSFQKVELYDWSANSYVVIDQRQTEFTATTIALSPNNPNRFKDASGLMRARITLNAPLLSNTSVGSAQIDQVTFRTSA